VTDDDGDSPRYNRRQGQSPHHADGEGFGLRSVRERLAGYFGPDAHLDLTREDSTTVARLELPIVEQTSPILGAAR
jgi:hypothetical protein